MTALDEIRAIKYPTKLDCAIMFFGDSQMCGDEQDPEAKSAAEELIALRSVAEAARPFSVMPEIEQKTVIDGRTFVSLEVGAIFALEAALKELEAVK